MWKRSFSIILIVIFFPSTVGIEFDPAKAIELLNDFVEHPKEVLEKLSHYKITDIVAALGIHSNENSNLSVPCQEELSFLGYGVIDYIRVGRNTHPSSIPQVMTEEERKFYLIPMLDSAGKIGSGIARGHLLSTGQFHECKSVQIFSTSLNRHISGDYYRILFDIKMRGNSQNGSCGMPQIGLDICLPKACSNDHLTEYFRGVLSSNPQNSPVCRVLNVNERVPKPVVTTYIVAAIVASICILSIISGIMDYYFRNRYTKMAYKKNESKSFSLWNIFMAFSFYRNFLDVFETGKGKKDGQVTSLNCIRTISTVWVILGHCSAIMILVCTNPMDMLDYSKSSLGLFMTNAYFAVDTFFFLSGFLLSLLWFKQFRKNRKSTMSLPAWIMFYLHRILRISPVYYITILFFTFVYTRSIHDVPFFMSPAISDETCDKNFWLNLLYIDNFVDTKHICYVISWYLATDFQIFLFTPFILIPFALGGKKFGLFISLTIIAISNSFNIYQMFAWYFPPTQFQFGPKDPRFDPERHRYDTWNYYNPLIRCPVYIIGIILGYFIQNTPKLKINIWLDRCLWFVAMASMCFVILVLQNYTSGTLWTPWENAIYSCCSRIVWGLGLSWVVISTYYRNGLINDFMSLPFWTPLAKLSFCAYLVHIMVAGYFFGKNHSELYFHTLPFFFLDTVIPVTCVSFLVAIVWTCMFELPFAKIIGLLLGGNRNSKEIPQFTPPPTLPACLGTNGIHKIPVNLPEEIDKSTLTRF